ncbi:MAG: cell division protein FtsA [Candidatus Omnitrophota bacterium]|jgi:cell division protein FtsA
MKKNIIVTGLDIGSSRISAVAAEVERGGGFNIAAQVSQPSRGVSRGAIVDLSEAVRSVSSVLGKLGDKISCKPCEIYVNISGDTVKGNLSNGMIPITLRGREIITPDIDRCVDAASTIHLPFDREIIHRVVHRFSVDDEPSIKNPIGLYASRIACEVYVVTANVNHIQNIYKCVNNAGFDVKGIVYTGIADGLSLLDKADMESGVLLLDIGSSLTEATLFFDGEVADIKIFPFGGEDIKGDFKNSPEFAGMLSSLNIEQAKNIMITGGMAFSDGIVEFLEEKLARPVKMGVVKDIRGDISSVDSVRLSTALGLAKYACRKYEKKLSESKNLAARLSTTVTDIFNNYF